jgi:hypothetical protein
MAPMRIGGLSKGDLTERAAFGCRRPLQWQPDDLGARTIMNVAMPL